VIRRRCSIGPVSECRTGLSARLFRRSVGSDRLAGTRRGGGPGPLRPVEEPGPPALGLRSSPPGSRSGHHLCVRDRRRPSDDRLSGTGPYGLSSAVHAAWCAMLLLSTERSAHDNDGGTSVASWWSHMTVTLLLIDGCPHWPLADTGLDTALKGAAAARRSSGEAWSRSRRRRHSGSPARRRSSSTGVTRSVGRASKRVWRAACAGLRKDGRAHPPSLNSSRLSRSPMVGVVGRPARKCHSAHE
jgi:hypothetical protein